jgi:ribosomal protein S18 acetylase RimI-like enzyme
MRDGKLVGVVICKLAPHKNTGRMRGYIAMLAVDTAHRGQGIATELVQDIVGVFFVVCLVFTESIACGLGAPGACVDARPCR